MSRQNLGDRVQDRWFKKRIIAPHPILGVILRVNAGDLVLIVGNTITKGKNAFTKLHQNKNLLKEQAKLKILKKQKKRKKAKKAAEQNRTVNKEEDSEDSDVSEKESPKE